MALFITDSQLVKSIGASGQLSLGKEFAGRQVLVESPAKGVWIIRTATVIPDNETWLHEKKTKVSLKKAIAWASKNPPTSQIWKADQTIRWGVWPPACQSAHQ